MATVVLVVGLLLAGYCLLVAAKPEWFKNFRVIRRSSNGDYQGSSRLGDSPPGLVRAVYLVIAGILVVGTFTIRSWALEDSRCDQAESVYAAGRTEKAWQTAAREAGFGLQVSKRTSYTSYTLSRDGAPVASWTDNSYARFSCPPRS
jgi:hypothetical protein